ncbi:50S ribosomal protein L18 [Methanobrevibacter filiformis]|uniref:Large ribosomal subunit protein uL18 n=1 Tax=Methanobrevibacter filiformis TaxID=55758 RepID=A0A162FJ33_9EURY|nr:50S ribosomal protein L18 [Methanobrevibacter filiformis]KZX10740.1 50S ribosomal protein L18 [Methanobrevibacter filiformis]
MAHGSKYKVAFRRRREGKTNYANRIKLIDLDTYRLVVRLSNANVIVQIIGVGTNGDETLVSAHSKDLQKIGWLGGLKNTSAAYLTAYLCAKRALKQGIEDAVLDIGLKSSTKGSKVFAALKGAVDAGLNVPHGESVLPDEDRITGVHIVEYAKLLDEEGLKKQFSQYLSKGLQPVDLPDHFETIKNKINNEA